MLLFSQQSPQMNWQKVVAELDHPRFKVTDKAGLHLLITALLRGLQDQPFPTDVIYQPWKNSEGQVTVKLS